MKKITFLLMTLLIISCSSKSDYGVNNFNKSLTIWNGATKTFTKSDGSNPASEANQDRLTSNVWITRGNEGGQIYNIAKESVANKTDSPIGTKWALGSISELESLSFTNFQTAVSDPKNAVGKSLVMFLEEDNIYLSVKFNSWNEGKESGFSYDRSSK